VNPAEKYGGAHFLLYFFSVLKYNTAINSNKKGTILIMKKIYAMILCLTLIATLFAGCGGNSGSDLAYIKEKVNVMGGYISNSHVSGRKPENYGERGRYASMTVRIPQERMESFLADARGVATVILFWVISVMRSTIQATKLPTPVTKTKIPTTRVTTFLVSTKRTIPSIIATAFIPTRSPEAKRQRGMAL